MAGTFFGLGLSTQFDASGLLARGCLLYVYEANTSTPVDVFSDFGLSSIHQFPIVGDGAGRLPAIWVDDGSYRIRLTTAAGVTIFDQASVTAVGASSGDSGGSVAADTENVFQTGDLLHVLVDTTRTGWVRCNGRTISSGSGAGTERANGDCEALFQYLWNNFSDALAPVSSGRGASATADFNANKTIGLPDARGKGLFGLDTMGNSAAGRITGATTPGTNGTTAGAQTVTLAQANLPNVSFTVSGTAASHTHGTGTYAVGSESSHTHGAGSFAVGTSITNGTANVRGSIVSVTAGGASRGINAADASSDTISLASGSVSGTSAAGSSHNHSLSGSSAASGTLDLTATAASGGSATAVNNMPPYLVGTVYIKL